MAERGSLVHGGDIARITEEVHMIGMESQRDAAIKRLKAQRDFRSHLVVYAVVNTMLIVIWAASGGGYFWPIWPLAGWGIGLILNAWEVYYRRPITEDEVQREMQRELIDSN